MNQDIEKVWRDEFEGYEFRGLKYSKNIYGEYEDRETGLVWLHYYTACKKRDEELEIERNLVKEYRDQCISNAEEIAQLKEQLKRESEFVDRIASNGLDVPVTIELMKRARSVQSQRGIL